VGQLENLGWWTALRGPHDRLSEEPFLQQLLDDNVDLRMVKPHASIERQLLDDIVSVGSLSKVMEFPQDQSLELPEFSLIQNHSGPVGMAENCRVGLVRTHVLAEAQGWEEALKRLQSPSTNNARADEAFVRVYSPISPRPGGDHDRFALAADILRATRLPRLGNVRHRKWVVPPMVTAFINGQESSGCLVCSILGAHGAHRVMWNSAWNELREVVYLAAMVGGLSVVGVGLAVALVLVGVA
jgi:hypothetical protein